MSKGRFKFISIVLVSALLLLPLVATAAQKMTAKEGIEKARAKARAWQADAVLIAINASNADKQGKATPHIVATAGLGWTYIFRSDKVQKNLVITMDDKGEIRTQEDMKSSVKAIAEDFIDSDKAMTEAVKNGFKPDDSDNYMGLFHGSCPRDSKVSLCWKLNASGAATDSTMQLMPRPDSLSVEAHGDS